MLLKQYKKNTNFNIFMTKTNGYYNEKLQRLWLNVFSADFKSGDMGPYSIWELKGKMSS